MFRKCSNKKPRKLKIFEDYWFNLSKNAQRQLIIKFKIVNQIPHYVSYEGSKYEGTADKSLKLIKFWCECIQREHCITSGHLDKFGQKL